MQSILKTLLLVIPLTLTGCADKPKAPDIKFAPYGADYSSKLDFAQLEYKYPLTREELSKLSPQNLAALDQEQLDQIYARLSAGPIPDGAYDGSILLQRGASGKLRVSEIVGGFTGWALHLKGMAVESVGESLWKGKVFFRDERVLRNRIEDLEVLRKAGFVEG
ncbi:MAG TPA: hypothetical protein VM532_14400, partial [Burkholderiales bacterium]|nr:hypothetical protein [Burkholderiales bacterium]